MNCTGLMNFDLEEDDTGNPNHQWQQEDNDMNSALLSNSQNQGRHYQQPLQQFGYEPPQQQMMGANNMNPPTAESSTGPRETSTDSSALLVDHAALLVKMLGESGEQSSQEVNDQQVQPPLRGLERQESASSIGSGTNYMQQYNSLSLDQSTNPMHQQAATTNFFNNTMMSSNAMMSGNPMMSGNLMMSGSTMMSANTMTSGDGFDTPPQQTSSFAQGLGATGNAMMGGGGNTMAGGAGGVGVDPEQIRQQLMLLQQLVSSKQAQAPAGGLSEQPMPRWNNFEPNVQPNPPIMSMGSTGGYVGLPTGSNHMLDDERITPPIPPVSNLNAQQGGIHKTEVNAEPYESAPKKLTTVVLKKKTLDKDRPKRPLSSYNIYFKEERERILKLLPDGASARKTQAEMAAFEEGDEDQQALLEELLEAQEASREKKEKQDTTTTKQLQDVDVKNLSTSRKRRSERKKAPHRKIGFAVLAKVIGQRWRNGIPEDKLKYYKGLAEADMRRYKAEMEVFNAKKRQKIQKNFEESIKSEQPASGKANDE